MSDKNNRGQVFTHHEKLEQAKAQTHQNRKEIERQEAKAKLKENMNKEKTD